MGPVNATNGDDRDRVFQIELSSSFGCIFSICCVSRSRTRTVGLGKLEWGFLVFCLDCSAAKIRQLYSVPDNGYKI